MVADKIFAWARKQVIRDLSEHVSPETHTSSHDSDELTCHLEGLLVRIRLWNSSAEVRVVLNAPIFPSTLQINESSAWGAQKYEAWKSGEAIRTGDTAFDDAFVVTRTARSAPSADNDAKNLSPQLKSALLRYRQEIRDAKFSHDCLEVTIPRSHGALFPDRPARMMERLSWTLGVVFFGIGRIPNAHDLSEGITRAVEVAQSLEKAAGHNRTPVAPS
jgi:hypothetical protein